MVTFRSHGTRVWTALGVCAVLLCVPRLAPAECDPADVRPEPGAAFIDVPAGMMVTIVVEKVTPDYGLALLGTLDRDIPIEDGMDNGVARLADPGQFKVWVDNAMNRGCATQPCELEVSFDTAKETRLGLREWQKTLGDTRPPATGLVSVEGPAGRNRVQLKGPPASDGTMHVAWQCIPVSTKAPLPF